MVELLTHQLEFFAHPAGANAKGQAAIAEPIERGCGVRDRERPSHGQDKYGRSQPYTRSVRCNPSQRYEWVWPWEGRLPAHLSVAAVGIPAVEIHWHTDVVP